MEINGIVVNGISALPSHRNGENMTDITVMVDAPMTLEQVAELTDGKGWTVTDGQETRMMTGLDKLVSVNYRFGASKGALELAREQAAAELEQVLADARSGLVTAPVDGEEWSNAKWYRTGDTVSHQGVAYVCVKTNKGHEPGADELITYWEAKADDPVEVLVWTDLESGTVIQVGQVVAHNEKTWTCLKEHTKSVVRQPSAVQVEYWEVKAT